MGPRNILDPLKDSLFSILYYLHSRLGCGTSSNTGKERFYFRNLTGKPETHSLGRQDSSWQR